MYRYPGTCGSYCSRKCARYWLLLPLAMVATALTRLLLALAALLLADAADNVLVRPWGENALRVQIAPSSWTLTDALPTAYLPGGPPGALSSGFGTPGFASALPSVADGPIKSGNIQAVQDVNGMLSFTRVSDSKVLFKETARTFSPRSSGAEAPPSSVTFDFSGTATKLYGMGQNRHQNNGAGLGLNVVGETYSFQSSIGEEGGPSNSLPWVLGADPSTGFQFGVLFNSPALGGAAHSNTNMTWSIIGDAGNQNPRQQFDFFDHDARCRCQARGETVPNDGEVCRCCGSCAKNAFPRVLALQESLLESGGPTYCRPWLSQPVDSCRCNSYRLVSLEDHGRLVLR